MGFLGHVVLRTFTSLGHLPVDVLVRGLDIARLAMDAAVPLLESLFSTFKKKIVAKIWNLLLCVNLETHAVRL